MRKGRLGMKGHLECLKWLLAKGAPLDERACTNAAGKGHLEVIKWLHEKGAPWNAIACAYAANNGHLEVLKWLLANGCPCSEYTKANAKQMWSKEEW